MMRGGVGRSGMGLPASAINQGVSPSTLLSGLDFLIEARSQTPFYPTTVPGGILDTDAYRYGAMYSTPSTEKTQFGAKNWSFAILFNPDITSSSGYQYQIPLCCDRFNSGRREFAFTVVRNNTVLPTGYFFNILVGAGVTATQQQSPGINYVPGVWCLCIGNHDISRKAIDIYVDGDLATSFNYSIDLGVSGDPLDFGARNTGGSTDGQCTGVRVQYIYKWNRLLDMAEISWLYNDGLYTFLT